MTETSSGIPDQPFICNLHRTFDSGNIHDMYYAIDQYLNDAE
jgi:hypothetical protein